MDIQIFWTTDFPVHTLALFKNVGLILFAENEQIFYFCHDVTHMGKSLLFRRMYDVITQYYTIYTETVLIKRKFPQNVSNLCRILFI